MWQSILEWIRIIGNYSGCHQKAERSFFYKGKQFPVCARCAGVCIGHFLAILGLVFGKTCKCISLPVLLVLVMGVDWGVQAIKVKESTNKRRFVTGIAGGYGLYSLYIIGIRYAWRKIKSVARK